MTDRNGNYIVTYTGEKFYPLDPRQEEIHIEDIAHALSHTCRYTGHVEDFYSVAEHSVRASVKASSYQNAFQALMHDASEAYLIDIPRPLKALPQFEEYLEIEDHLMYMIGEHFGFAWPMDPEVKDIDNEMLKEEWKSLMPLTPELLEESFFQEVDAYDGPAIETWTPREAEQNFLERFDELERRL